MTSRGVQHFAVMAIKDGWKKPRFVWNYGTRQLEIFHRRRDAQRRAKVMSNPEQIGGKLFFCTGYTDRTQNTPVVVDVRWIVVPVWTEMML